MLVKLSPARLFVFKNKGMVEGRSKDFERGGGKSSIGLTSTKIFGLKSKGGD